MQMFAPIRACSCGSGNSSEWKYDARGIELCRACASCWPMKRKQYRPEVLDDSQYEADEPIESEE